MNMLTRALVAATGVVAGAAFGAGPAMAAPGCSDPWRCIRGGAGDAADVAGQVGTAVFQGTVGGGMNGQGGGQNGNDQRPAKGAGKGDGKGTGTDDENETADEPKQVSGAFFNDDCDADTGGFTFVDPCQTDSSTSSTRVVWRYQPPSV